MDKTKRESIEKWICEVGGQWPEHFQENSFLIEETVGYEISKEEFKQVKADMQNKPSWDDAPEWASWLAQGDCGEWDWFERKPTIYDGVCWDIVNSSDRWSRATKGKILGDWCNTLEKRPQQTEQPMKYQYGVEYECDGVKPDLPDDVLVEVKFDGGYKNFSHISDYYNQVHSWSWGSAKAFRIIDERFKPKEPGSLWFEKGELPPVGTECEVIRSDWDVWEKCKVLFVGELKVVFKSESRVECAWDIEEIKFRPLRTERDELIERACHLMNERNASPLFSVTKAAENLIDAGWRPTK
jgi:hypothetical protein